MSVLKHFSITTEPSIEPVTANEFKVFVNVNENIDDSLIDMLLEVARKSCEEYTNRKFINTTIRQTQSFFERDKNVYPSIDSLLSYQASSNYASDGQSYIRLQFKQVQSVESLITYDSSNNPTTYDAANYTVDIDGSKVLIKDDVALPSEIRDIAGIQTTYVSGFGASADDVPSDIKYAILMYTQSLYDFNRGAETLVAEAYTMPTGCKDILKRYRLEPYG